MHYIRITSFNPLQQPYEVDIISPNLQFTGEETEAQRG